MPHQTGMYVVSTCVSVCSFGRCFFGQAMPFISGMACVLSVCVFWITEELRVVHGSIHVALGDVFCRFMCVRATASAPLAWADGGALTQPVAGPQVQVPSKLDE